MSHAMLASGKPLSTTVSHASPPSNHYLPPMPSIGYTQLGWNVFPAPGPVVSSAKAAEAAKQRIFAKPHATHRQPPAEPPMRTMRRCPTAFLLLPLLTACAGNELVGIHVAMQGDGTAIVTTRALAANPAPPAAEVLAKGITWQTRGALVYSQGTATDLGQLRIGDDSLRFQPRLDGEPKTMRVVLQRGPDAGWVKALTPDQATRRNLAKVYDPSHKTKEIADQLRLEIQGLGPVVSSNVLPAARGVTADREGDRAYLVIPANTALEKGPELVWDISWK